jgi:hypothetical protein
MRVDEAELWEELGRATAIEIYDLRPHPLKCDRPIHAAIVLRPQGSPTEVARRVGNLAARWLKSGGRYLKVNVQPSNSEFTCADEPDISTMVTWIVERSDAARGELDEASAESRVDMYAAYNLRRL